MLLCRLGYVKESFPLHQHVYDFIRGIKVHDFVEGTRFDLVMSLFVMRRLGELNWAINGCLGWCHCEFRTGIMWDVPAYRRHVREFQKSNSVFLTGAKTWAMEKVVEKLERAKQRPDI